MKKKTNAKKPSHNAHCVCLELIFPEAHRICVVGSFNDWQPEILCMTALSEGKWITELMLPPGRYEYLFVVDDLWLPDPAAVETVPNPYGGQNSVLTVSAPDVQRPTKPKKK